MPDRRREIRLPLPEGSVSGFQGSGKILDISPTGVRVEVSPRCVFARGELHRLVLSDLLDRVEIESRVRWTRSSWRDSVDSSEGHYVQTAGFAFNKLLSDLPSGMWSALLAFEADLPAVVEAEPPAAAEPVVEPATSPVGEAPKPSPKPSPKPEAQARTQPKAKETRPSGSRRPPSPLTLVEPSPGTTVSGNKVKIVCAIENPEALSGFRINGVDAVLEGDRGTVEVELQKGDNRIVSMVQRRDGTYSTYLLGKIARDKTH